MSSVRQVRRTLLAVAAFLSACHHPPSDFYEGIPPGPRFPVPEATIGEWIRNERIDKMREHAWDVFAAMVQPSLADPTVARWETWYDRDFTLSPGEVNPAQRVRLARPIGDFPEMTPPESPEQHHEPGQLVMYNREAFRHIRQKKLYLRRTLCDLLQTQQEIAPFPPASVALKSEWLLVSQNSTDIGVWESKRQFPGKVKNGLFNLPRQVCVADEARKCAGKEFHPLSSFYHFRVTADRLARLRTTSKQFQRANQGDYVILAGLHFATREQSNWVWATFWWHPEPDRGRFAENRPPSGIPRPWTNYLMNVAYDMDLPREPDGRPHIAFNPYLEGSFYDGVTSNCVTCHRRATFSGRPDVEYAYQTSAGDVVANGPMRLVVRGEQAATHTYLDDDFSSLLKLSFLWSLTRAQALPNDPPCPAQ